MVTRYFIHSVALGIKGIKLHKLRSFLTILGVVFGVASVMIMLAVGEGARAEAIAAIEQLGATNIIIRSVNPLEPGAQVNLGANRYGISMRDMQRLQSTLPTLAGLAPTREHPRSVRHHTRSLNGQVVAVTPDYRDLHNLKIREGRFIESLDLAQALPVVVLAADAAADLFPISSPLGESIRIGEHQYFRAVGVLGSTAVNGASSSPQQSSDQSGSRVYIPFSTDAKRFGTNIAFDRSTSIGEKVEVSSLVLSVHSTDQVQPAARIVESTIQELGKEKEVAMTVPLDLLEKAEQTQRVFTWVLTAIASISLLVGGIGIMNIMLATVTERTREIGIRRALGAKRRDIVAQFLVETSALSGCGGILGVLLGIAGASIAGQLAEMPTLIRPWVPILAFGISLSVGLVFGTYPARRAAAMNPVEALRHE
jgi:putative ABC transport system permease protein